MEYLNLADIRECTESEGPGKRFALWCQGCLKRCPGCCNTHMQPLIENNIVSSDDLIELIKSSEEKYNIEGVSFIGGEPMLQARGLSKVAEWCQKNDLSVLIFTGYLLDELKDKNDENTNILLQNTDLLVDGPFIQEEYDNERDWIGSKNQCLHFLSNRYSSGIEKSNNYNSVELIFSEDLIHVNGWPVMK